MTNHTLALHILASHLFLTQNHVLVLRHMRVYFFNNLLIIYYSNRFAFLISRILLCLILAVQKYYVRTAISLHNGGSYPKSVLVEFFSFFHRH